MPISFSVLICKGMSKDNLGVGTTLVNIYHEKKKNTKLYAAGSSDFFSTHIYKGKQF